LALIQTDNGSQARVKIHTTVVRDYAEAMRRQLAEGQLRFPPVILFFDGRDYWLGDGCHRALAARQIGQAEIGADIRPGGQRDALLYSISANSTHGLPRTNADKRRAVALLLADPEWSLWSDREIARLCQVSHPVVRRLRRRASGTEFQMRERKVRRGGKVYDMTTKPGNDPAQKQAETSLQPSLVPAAADPTPVPAFDPLGLPVPQERCHVFGQLPVFQEARHLFDRLAKLIDKIAQGPSGESYRQGLVRTLDNGQPAFACPALRAALAKLVAAEPYCCYCPNCQAMHPGRANPLCKKCNGRGWTTRTAFESCLESNRQLLLQLHGAASKHGQAPGRNSS